MSEKEQIQEQELISAAQRIYDETGVTINSLEFEWLAYTTINFDTQECNSVSMRSHAKKTT
jgi:hypothetical protein